jgi:spermidine synthase
MQAMFRLSEFFLYKTVFLTGAAVLVIEIAAVRMLSPYYGASLYVFSSVLTIILAALASGYYIGGRLADRLPRHETLYAVITVSGLLTLLAQFLASTVLPFAEGIFSVMTGPLIFGFFLFFTPSFLLGIVSPYLVKLLVSNRSHSEVGSVAGTVFFFGTLGSITGSLLSGFVLIPLFGIRHAMSSTGVILVLIGIMGILFYEQLRTHLSPFVMVRRYRAFLFFIGISTALLLGLIYNTTIPFLHTVLYRSDGMYGHITIYETDHKGHPLRILKRDINNESAVYLDSYDLVFEYTQFAEWYKTLVPEAERFLMIGGGAYSIPRTLLARDEDLEVVVAEIEPDLFPLARRFFDLGTSTRLTNYLMDGRVFLNQNEKPFDVIFLDAFGTDHTLPAHLTTIEFFEQVKSNMSPEGILIINYIGYPSGIAPTLTGSLIKTVSSVFPNMRAYALYPGSHAIRQNIVFVLRNGSMPIDLHGKEIRLYDDAHHFVDDLEIGVNQYLVDDELIFTDDRAPIEFLLINQQ